MYVFCITCQAITISCFAHTLFACTPLRASRVTRTAMHRVIHNIDVMGRYRFIAFRTSARLLAYTFVTVIAFATIVAACTAVFSLGTPLDS